MSGALPRVGGKHLSGEEQILRLAQDDKARGLFEQKSAQTQGSVGCGQGPSTGWSMPWAQGALNLRAELLNGSREEG